MNRILLIDDDEAVRTILARILTHSGYSVIEACNGKVGLDLFPQSGADLVITDIVMPEAEGFEVLMTLRQLQPAVKIIAMSGGGRESPEDYLQAATFMGASKVLAKPFSNEALLAAIKDVLPAVNP